MPQLDSGGGGAGGGDDLGAPDELLAFQDEGEEQDDKSRDSAAGPERDLAELKSSLVNESEGAAGGTGVPGTGAGTRGEAEVGAEVSAGPRPAPSRQPRPGPRLSLTAPPSRGPRGPHPSETLLSLTPSPQLFLRPSRALCISPQALGREHTSQRLFPDKLPESLEDGEFLHGLAALHPRRPRPPWEGGSRGSASPRTAAPGGGKTEGVGGVGGGFPGRLRARVTSGALTFIGVNRPPPSPPPLLPR